MKKLTLLICLIVFLGSLCGCGNDIEIDESKYETEATTEEVTIDPVEARKVLLKEAYENHCEPDIGFANLSADGTSLVIDTNPYDTSYSYTFEEDAIKAVLATNEYLGLPSSVTDKMSSTRALDGMQSQDCGDFTATWTYHPDKGLHVIYEVNFS